MNLPEPLPDSQDMRNKVLYNWLNRLRDYCQSITPQFGGGLKMQRNSSGFTYVVPPSLGGGTVTTSVSCYQCTIVQEAANYLQCTYSGVDSTGKPVANAGQGVNVAKPPELQGFVGGTVDSQGNPQSIWTPYAVKDIIYAIQPTGGTGVTVATVAVTLMDLNVAARALGTTIGTCESIGGVATAKRRLFICSTYS